MRDTEREEDRKEGRKERTRVREHKGLIIDFIYNYRECIMAAGQTLRADRHHPGEAGHL